MAAPGATFRRLLPLSRWLPSRPVLPAAARPYGVRASGTGELVTHTGQVSARGRGGRRRAAAAAARGSVLPAPLPGEGGRVRAASAGSCGTTLAGLRAAL